MAVSISVQETTVLPTTDGYAVELHISDKPPDALDAALVLTLRVKIDRTGTARLVGIQRKALEAMEESLRPLLQELHEKMHDLR